MFIPAKIRNHFVVVLKMAVSIVFIGSPRPSGCLSTFRPSRPTRARTFEFRYCPWVHIILAAITAAKSQFVADCFLSPINLSPLSLPSGIAEQTSHRGSQHWRSEKFPGCVRGGQRRAAGLHVQLQHLLRRPADSRRQWGKYQFSAHLQGQDNLFLILFSPLTRKANNWSPIYHYEWLIDWFIGGLPLREFMCGFRSFRNAFVQRVLFVCKNRRCRVTNILLNMGIFKSIKKNNKNEVKNNSNNKKKFKI